MSLRDVLILDAAPEGQAPLVAREIWRICSLIRETGISSVIVGAELLQKYLGV
ncbi:MAG: hypothetical protein ACYCZL_04700 [Polaromonas sp.]